MALNLSQRPQPYGAKATQVLGTSESERREETDISEAEEPKRIPTSTVAGEHLTRASLVVASTHKEEIVIGEEEGPSEEVPTNEPMTQPGEKSVKHEIIEERQAGEENSTVGTAEEVSQDLPPAAEMKEVLIKQEWIEMCEQ